MAVRFEETIGDLDRQYLTTFTQPEIISPDMCRKGVVYQGDSQSAILGVTVCIGMNRSGEIEYKGISGQNSIVRELHDGCVAERQAYRPYGVIGELAGSKSLSDNDLYTKLLDISIGYAEQEISRLESLGEDLKRSRFFDIDLTDVQEKLATLLSYREVNTSWQ